MQFFYDRGCGPNYVGKHIKSLKTIMRAGRDEGLHNSNEIERRAFKSISEPVDAVYLNEGEIEKLYNLNLSEHKNLQEIRNMFSRGLHRTTIQRLFKNQ